MAISAKWLGVTCSCGVEIATDPQAFPDDKRSPYDRLKEAIAAWNRRSLDMACLNCGVFRGSDLYASPPSPAEVTITDEMVERGLDAPVVGACPAIDYLDFNAADAKELGVLIEGENFSKLDIIRHEQWRDAGRAIVRAILAAALQLNKKG
jgi:hypothetical protein